MREWLEDIAQKRPLGPETEPSIGVPRVLIFHTMVGNLAGTESMFRQNGYDGTESTFGLGGPHDGSLDGVLWQWQGLSHQADAQFDGNDYANSVETADGGDPNTPWSTKQLDALVRLTVAWCKETGNPCVLVAKSSDHGLGYHEQFPEWNKTGHTCPGAVREGQLRTVVIPRARDILAGRPTSPKPQPKPSTNPSRPALAVDGVLGHDTIVALQKAVLVPADGDLGPVTRKAVQRHLGQIADGIWGKETVKAIQRRVGSPADGVLGRETIKALQRALNGGKF